MKEQLKAVTVRYHVQLKNGERDEHCRYTFLADGEHAEDLQCDVKRGYGLRLRQLERLVGLAEFMRGRKLDDDMGIEIDEIKEV